MISRLNNTRGSLGKAGSSSFVSDQVRTNHGWRDYLELTKPRLSMMSVITAIVGYLVANPTRDLTGLFALILGSMLAAAGAGVLNQWLEREVDAKMVRTSKRALPVGAVSAKAALVFGLVLSFVGPALLWLGNNGLTAFLAVATILSYIVVYTPMKQMSPWCTHVGAIPGALPPLMGWAAAEGKLGELGWILFAILFAWQIPHFMAIAWTYREDYARANMPMFSVVDPSGKHVAFQSIGFVFILLVVSLLPVFLGLSTPIYGVFATLIGLYFLYWAYRFARSNCEATAARKLFFASLFYLPFLLAVMVIDRLLLVSA